MEDSRTNLVNVAATAQDHDQGHQSRQRRELAPGRFRGVDSEWPFDPRILITPLPTKSSSGPSSRRAFGLMVSKPGLISERRPRVKRA